jgi:alpha-L-fucosidase
VTSSRSWPGPRARPGWGSAAGLRFGVYYSGGIDWYAGRRAVIRHESQIDDYGRANEAAYAAYALAQVRDLIARYRPDVLWNDIGWPDLGLDDLPALFADYRAVVPDGVVNDRWDGTHAARPSVSYDFLTSEYQANRDNEGTGAWENCRGIGYSFGFNQVEGPAHCLSTAAAVRLLADIVSRGGNLLLNVGPRSDGTLPPRQRAVLAGMASWMAVNSVAIHDTRPLPEASPGDIPWLRWTRSADHVYALVADVPAGEVLLRHPGGLANPVRLDGGPVTARTVPGATAVTIDAVGPLPVVIRFGLSA